MPLFADLHRTVTEALGALAREGLVPGVPSPDQVTVEPPRDAAHGEAATNAAMVAAAAAGLRPRPVAEALAERLAGDPRIASAAVAGPGFVNLTFHPEAWRDVIATVLEQGADYGRPALGQGKKVLVEYVSAYPTGPLSAAHARGAVYGDALARLLAHAGWDVTREYYVNDGGGQADTLARSVYLRYLEAQGQAVAFEHDTHAGDDLIAVAQHLSKLHGTAFLDQPEHVWLDEVRAVSVAAMMETIRADLAALGIVMDSYFSERALAGTGRIEMAVADLEARGLIYRGVLEAPDGGPHARREQTLFRATAHGDDTDRPVQTAEGAWTYFAPDIAYHHDKLDRGFAALVDVFAADHGGYVKRMKAVVSALSDGRVPLDIKLTQMVRLWRDGVPLRGGSPAGGPPGFRALVDEAGADTLRFHLLMRKNDASMDLDLARLRDPVMENPAWVVQYAHVRLTAALRLAAPDGDAPRAAPPAHPLHLALARRLADWPRVVELAARLHEPHRLAFALHDLARGVHALCDSGVTRPGPRLWPADDRSPDPGEIALLTAAKIVISAGLGILGVTPVEQMR